MYALFSSVTQSCLTLCDPLDCSMPGFPVHHQLPELTYTHVHRIDHAIQPSHPLSSASPPAFYLSQHQGLSNKSALHIRWPKYWSFSFSISPSNEYPGLISFKIDWFDLLAVQGTLESLLQQHSSDTQLLGCASVRFTNSMDTETRVNLSSKTGHERSQTRTSTFWMSPVCTV